MRILIFILYFLQNFSKQSNVSTKLIDNKNRRLQQNNNTNQISCKGVIMYYTEENNNSSLGITIRRGCYCPWDLYGFNCEIFRPLKCLINKFEDNFNLSSNNQIHSSTFQAKFKFKCEQLLPQRQGQGIKHIYKNPKVIYNISKFNQDLKNKTIDDSSYGTNNITFEYIFDKNKTKFSKIANSQLKLNIQFIDWKQQLNNKIIFQQNMSYQFLNQNELIVPIDLSSILNQTLFGSLTYVIYLTTYYKLTQNLTIQFPSNYNSDLQVSIIRNIIKISQNKLDYLQSNKLSTGVIVAIVLSSILLLIIITVIIYICVFKKKKMDLNQNDDY